MNFFKKLFSSKSEAQNSEGGNFKGVYSTEYFSKRYEEKQNDPVIFDGALKMIDSYYLDNKLERIIPEPLNDPKNLDQVVVDGMGFHAYCKSFNLEDRQIILFLAFGFAEYLMKTFGFKQYKDNEPEFPLRSMALIFDRNGGMLSLYPMEYSLKVLNGEASFDELVGKVRIQVESLPDKDDLLDILKED